MADLPNTQLNQNQIPNNQPQNKKEEIKEFEEEVVPNVTNIKTQETFLLPSKGLFYNNPNMKSITLRRMTVKEDKLRLRNEREDVLRKKLLQACTVGEGIDIGQLTLFDVNYLLFCLRRISLLNNTYKVRCICPHCEAEFIDEVDLSKLKIKYAEQENLPNFDMVLPISKMKIRLKYPSLNSTISLRENITEYLKMNPEEDIGELLYEIGDLVYIDTVNGNRLLSEELEDLLGNLDVIDSRTIKDGIRKLDGLYGIDDSILCKCPNCKQDVEHGLPITGELFTPSL